MGEAFLAKWGMPIATATAGALQGVFSPGENSQPFRNKGNSAEELLAQATKGTSDSVDLIMGNKPWSPGAASMIQTPVSIQNPRDSRGFSLGVLPMDLQSRGDLGWAPNQGLFGNGFQAPDLDRNNEGPGFNEHEEEIGENGPVRQPREPSDPAIPQARMALRSPDSGAGFQPAGAEFGSGPGARAPSNFAEMLARENAPQQQPGGDMNSFLAAMRLIGGK